MKQKYKIRQGFGKHTDENGKVHRAGDTFMSDRDLDRKKFKRVGKGKKSKDEEKDDTPAADIDDIVNDDDDDDDGEGSGDEPIITLKAVNQGPKQWDVVKVVDGEETDDAVNEEFLSQAEAKEMVKAGYQGEED